jgi:ribonuclease HI
MKRASKDTYKQEADFLRVPSDKKNNYNQMNKTTTETRKYRTEMNDKILNSGFNDYKKFFALDNKAYINGALPAKTKELMGLVASMVLRCNDCIFYHIDRSIQEGATREELHESFNIALIVGGSIVIPHLRYAFDIMDDIIIETENEQ